MNSKFKKLGRMFLPLIFSFLFLLYSPNTLADTATGLNVPIESNGDVPAVSIACIEGHNYTLTLVHRDEDVVNHSYGSVERKYCSDGVITFSGFNINTKLEASDPTWWNWFYSPLEYIIKDSTGANLPFCDVSSCTLLNLHGAFNSYNKSVYLASSTYWTTIGAGPVFYTDDHLTWSNSANGDGSVNYIATHIISFEISTSTRIVNIHNYINPNNINSILSFKISSSTDIYTADPVIATTTGDFYYSWSYPDIGYGDFIFYSDIASTTVLTSTSTVITLVEPPPTYSSVLFLPGVQASRLYEPLVCDAGTCDTLLWEPQGDTKVARLEHNTDGSSKNSDIYAGGVIDNAFVPIKGNIYKSFIEQMDVLVTDGTINDWEAVAYDWRLTPEQILTSGKLIAPNKISYLLATSSPYIIQELRRLASGSNSGKVTIVAHSNGGIITKKLTELLGVEAETLIDKIIFVAVPQVGTPKAVGVILHGFDQRFWFLNNKISTEEARILATNMPAPYNLLPSTQYFTQVDDPAVTFDSSAIVAEFRERYGDIIHSGERLKTFITDSWRSAFSTSEDISYPSVGNTNRYSDAEALHSSIDNWSPPTGVKLYEIAGWGENTP